MRPSKFIRRTEGSIGPISAIVLTVAVGAMSVGIDLGHLFLVKCELQRAADAGALAGAFAFVDRTDPNNPNLSCTRALTASQKVVADNTADGEPLTLPSDDVTLGRWDLATNTFIPLGCSNPFQITAVKVVTRRDQTANGPVSLFFSKILPGGMVSSDLTAEAVAILGGVGHAPPGVGAFPIAVDQDKVPPNNTPFKVHLNPTPGDDGCWHSYTDNSSGTSDTRSYIDGSQASPDLKVGEDINVKEGVADSALQEVSQQLNQKTSQGQTYDVLVPIIPSNSSHSGWQPIQGFAMLRITDVSAHGSDKYVEGHIVSQYVAPGAEPGGPNFGTWAAVPKLAN